MTDEYFVDAAAVQRDAEQFLSWSHEVEAMAAALPVEIARDAFALIPGVDDAISRVTSAATVLRDSLQASAANLDAIATKLQATMRIYTEAETASTDDIDRIARELDTL